MTLDNQRERKKQRNILLSNYYMPGPWCQVPLNNLTLMSYFSNKETKVKGDY